MLARAYGEPSFWLNPDLDSVVIETAIDLIREATDSE